MSYSETNPNAKQIVSLKEQTPNEPIGDSFQYSFPERGLNSLDRYLLFCKIFSKFLMKKTNFWQILETLV
jgi:hypothetical protein